MRCRVLGVSAMVSAPHDQGPPPKVGSFVQVGVHIGAAFTPVTPASWATDDTCAPAYDEEHGTPAGPPTTPSLTQTSISSSGKSTSSSLEAVVQTNCPGPKLILSADDIRESGRDLAPLDVPAASTSASSARARPSRRLSVSPTTARSPSRASRATKGQTARTTPVRVRARWRASSSRFSATAGSAACGTSYASSLPLGSLPRLTAPAPVRSLLFLLALLLCGLSRAVLLLVLLALLFVYVGGCWARWAMQSGEAPMAVISSSVSTPL